MKIKINLRQIVKIQIIVICIIILIIIGGSSYFLYKNFYKTLTDTKKIMLIQNQVILETINIEKFDDVITKIQNKKAPPDVDWATFKDPFQSYGTETEN